MMLRYLLFRTHEVGWKKQQLNNNNKRKEKKRKEKKSDAEPIFIRPRHKEILCMKHGFECLIASQMIISSFLFSQN